VLCPGHAELLTQEHPSATGRSHRPTTSCFVLLGLFISRTMLFLSYFFVKIA